MGQHLFPMLGDWIVRIGKAYWYVVSIFIGAAVFAIVLPPVVQMLHFTSQPAQKVRDFCWIAGALVTAVGSPMGWFRFTPFRTGPAAATPISGPDDPPASGPPDRSLSHALRTGGVSAFFGGVFGFLLGATFAIVWMSLAISPWSPAEWAKGMTFRGGGFRTSNPIPFLLWFGPVVALAVLGFLFGVVGAPRGWVTESPRIPKPWRRTDRRT